MKQGGLILQVTVTRYHQVILHSKRTFRASLLS